MLTCLKGQRRSYRAETGGAASIQVSCSVTRKLQTSQVQRNPTIKQEKIRQHLVFCCFFPENYKEIVENHDSLANSYVAPTFSFSISTIERGETSQLACRHIHIWMSYMCITGTNRMMFKKKKKKISHDITFCVIGSIFFRPAETQHVHAHPHGEAEPPAHLWPMLIWLDRIMVMCAGIWWVWGDALLLLFRGIANWLGGFDVVVMREKGVGGRGWRRRPATRAHFYFWPGRDLCWRTVRRNETWWNRWEMTPSSAQYSVISRETLAAVVFSLWPIKGSLNL